MVMPGENVASTVELIAPITMEEGKTVTFKAMPADGYETKEWQIFGTAVPGNTSTTYEHTITEAADISVSFVSSIKIGRAHV